MTNYVLLGLTKRRAELTGEIEATHKRLRAMLADLDTIDKTIVQFDPDFQVETIKPKAFRPPADWAHRGEMSKISLSILRQAAEPMTTRDIALELLITRAMDPQDQRMLRTMVRRVGTALRTQRENGVVLSRQGAGQFVLWEVAR